MESLIEENIKGRKMKMSTKMSGKIMCDNFNMKILSALILLLSVAPYSYADCQLPSSWKGRWFHLGFPEPLRIESSGISGKGRCVEQQPEKNMYLLQDSENSYDTCYRCMMIYEKHFNVLQYKESYCEERIESMESLCNTIAGDAPLYTMFRKEADLVKCPFRGPYSFSYSKGGRGQVCEYPPSYMDTCSDNKRLQLRYQACMDVEGSEIAQEEMSCLATWRDGSSRYLVAMLNHSHVYSDNARYRCFVYQKVRNHHHRRKSHLDGNGLEDNEHMEHGGVVYKMAQSTQASCLGLWSVDEGYRTFTLKKLEKEGSPCEFPSWMEKHRDWRSVDDHSVIHINRRGHSLRLTNQTSDGDHVESHATCHSIENLISKKPNSRDSAVKVSRIVAHVKSGCDSGYVCMEFNRRDEHVIQMRYGGQARHPSEACMNYYFDTATTPLTTLISPHKSARPCPFSGRYAITGQRSALASLVSDMPGLSRSDLFDADGRCHTLSVFMHAGCGGSDSSSDVRLEATCYPRPSRLHYQMSHLDEKDRYAMVNDEPVKSAVEFKCHGKWREIQTLDEQENYVTASSLSAYTASNGRDANHLLSVNPGGLLLSGPGGHRVVERHHLMLSSGFTMHEEDNSLSRRFLCLAYYEVDGIMVARADPAACKDQNFAFHQQSQSSDINSFNITSSGACLQALTGQSGGSVGVSSAAVSIERTTSLVVVLMSVMVSVQVSIVRSLTLRH